MTFDIGRTKYIGPVEDISRDMLNTVYTDDGSGTIEGSIGGSFFAKGGATFGYTPTSKGNGLVTVEWNIGGGLPAGILPAYGSAGVSQTKIIFDFKSKRDP